MSENILMTQIRHSGSAIVFLSYVYYLRAAKLFIFLTENVEESLDLLREKEMASEKAAL